MDNLQAMLDSKASEIVDEAMDAIRRAHLKHYESAGIQPTRVRLAGLYALTRQCVGKRTLTPIIEHAERIAAERYAAGYDLAEIQTAFNALEEVIWKRVLTELPSGELAEALGLVSTVLGAGKDALARKYVSLVSGTRAPSLDLAAMFD